MQNTRDRLIEVAAQLLDEGGPAAVTLREVAGRAGFSHNTPYKHFADKDDMLATIAAVELRELAEKVATASGTGGPGSARLVSTAHAYLGWARARPARFKLVFGSWSGPHDELGEAAGAATEAMYAAVRAAQAEDPALPRDADQVVSLLWSLAHGAIDLDLAGHLRKRPGSPSVEELVDTLVRSLR